MTKGDTMRTMQESELLSWKEIWLAASDGTHRDLERAINDHVERFPPEQHDEVRLRAVHIVRTTLRQKDEIRSRIRRVSSTIRTLQKGRFNASAARQECRDENRSA